MWPPQNNGCPIKQPCDSGCTTCSHFKVGDRVISIAGQQIGFKGILVSSYMDGEHHLFMVKWRGDPREYGKYVQHYRLLLDQNDIAFHKR